MSSDRAHRHRHGSGKRTKELVRRLHPDDIAIIDHTDLDRVSAEELVESGVRVVVNVAPSQSGRYPNPGPLLLVRGGVRLIDVDDAGSLRRALRRRAADRSRREPLPERHLPRDRPRARGARARRRARSSSRAASPRRCRSSPTTRCATCATRAGCSRRGSTSPRSRRASATATRSSSRAGPATSATCGSSASYVRDFRPVLVAVDGGAEALRRGGLEAGRDRRRHGLGHRRDAALRRRDPRPRLPRGRTRRARSGCSGSACPFQTVAAPGISEDIALLLAHEKGAELIVAVGTHFNLVEFLERNRAGMSSTFVTRLKVGEILIDAKGVSRLVSRRIGVWPLVLFGARRARGARRRGARLTGAAERRSASRLHGVFDLRYHVASLAAVFLMLVGRDPDRRRHLRPRLRRRRRARPPQRQDRRPRGAGRRRERERRRLRAAPAGGRGLRRERVPRPGRQADSTGSASPCSCSGSVDPTRRTRSSARSRRTPTGSVARMRALTLPLRLEAVEAALSEQAGARRLRRRRAARQPRPRSRPRARRRRRHAALGRARGRARRGARGRLRASPVDGVVVMRTGRAADGRDVALPRRSLPGARQRRRARRRRRADPRRAERDPGLPALPALDRRRRRHRARARSRCVLVLAGAGRRRQLRRPRHRRRRILPPIEPLPATSG